ncbi:MAG: FtsX-like permease family protein, partial [Planctomycetes bacterium]|nr:FtsX-like permease family protein [Planctomycetota bacterium]
AAAASAGGAPGSAAPLPDPPAAYLEVRARDAAALAELRARVAAAAPELEVKAIDQVMAAEESALGRIEWLLTLIAVVVLATAGLAVASALTISVLERRAEIGLLKVLGAGGGRILGLFVGESVAVALAGGLPGGLLGLALSDLVARKVFGVSAGADARAVLYSLAAAFFVALVSSALPVRRALLVDPVVTLRGD